MGRAMSDRPLPHTPSAGEIATDIERLSARLMAQHGISYNGRHYQYRAHRHGELADAVKHALAQHAPRATEVATPAPAPAHEHAGDHAARRGLLLGRIQL